MTRSNILLQSLAAVLFVSLFALAMPVSAWGGNYGSHYYNHDRDRNDRTPSCWIKVQPNTVYYSGGTVTLEWDSSDAEWAHISDVGTVATDGTMRVPVMTSKTITMTVYNGDRSSTCDTFVNIVGEYRSQHTNTGYGYYQPQTPYVYLTQIPYTGFDFGPLGNAIYWMTFGVIAIAGAYLLVYQSGMRALSTVPVLNEIIRAGRLQIRAMRRVARETYAQTQVTIHSDTEAVAPARSRGDVMKVIEGETPHIIIERD